MQVVNRTRKRKAALLRNIGLSVAAALCAPIAYNGLRTFLATDAFKNLFAGGPREMAESIGSQMDDVQLRDYNGGKLVSSASAQRIDFRKDRQGFTLYGVTNGIYNGDKGQFRYTASTAVWNLQVKQVTVNDQV